MVAQQKQKYDRTKVKIAKGATNAVFVAVPTYDDVRRYGKLYGKLQRAGKVKDNAAWEAAIADVWEVSHSTVTFYTCSSQAVPRLPS